MAKQKPAMRDVGTKLVVTSTHGVWVTEKGVFIICPACRLPKELGTFGIRLTRNGELRNQSHCIACRK
jgi:hypothetical protein